MKSYSEYWYQSQDGLRLYARDYNAVQSPLTLLCMHGLTRNSADFEELCEELYPAYRIIAVDQRGRGKSQWDSNPQNYQPLMYVQDMFRLIDNLKLENLVLVGTSLGGMMAMMMNAMRPGTFTGVIINDIGPVIENAGLDRIKSYAGKQKPATDWQGAIANTREINEIAFPDESEEFWERFAKRVYAENDKGVPELLYDPAISQPFAGMETQEVAQDLWPAFEPLGPVPLLVVRGELSDLLSRKTVTEMIRRKPDTRLIEVARVGHAPMLSEPEAVATIKQFLSDLS